MCKEAQGIPEVFVSGYVKAVVVQRASGFVDMPGRIKRYIKHESNI
jgi:hypothetical protein